MLEAKLVIPFRRLDLPDLEALFEAPLGDLVMLCSDSLAPRKSEQSQGILWEVLNIL